VSAERQKAELPKQGTAEMGLAVSSGFPESRWFRVVGQSNASA
jgi:hypothetical protein